MLLQFVGSAPIPLKALMVGLIIIIVMVPALIADRRADKARQAQKLEVARRLKVAASILNIPHPHKVYCVRGEGVALTAIDGYYTRAPGLVTGISSFKMLWHACPVTLPKGTHLQERGCSEDEQEALFALELPPNVIDTAHRDLQHAFVLLSLDELSTHPSSAAV